jgi:hypothetical protein
MESKLPHTCPSCGAELRVKTLQCSACSTTIDGMFPLPLLCLLEEEQKHFILNFVKHSGSLKKMSKELDLSYPTVRNMLNELIDKIHELENREEAES